MRRPSNNPITLGYGAVDPSLGYTAASPHGGTDFSHSPDPNIYAPEAGTINFVGWMGTAGNATELTGASGRKWRFCHQSSFNVFQGQQVGEGQVLGVMGQTGNAFGVHLHLILFINNNRVDPISVLPAAVGTTGGTPMIPDLDNYYARYGIDLALKIRGRTLSREEFTKYIVGVSDLRAIEILSDDPEAAATQNAQNLGQTALREDWSGKIARLSNELTAAKATIDDLNNELTSARSATVTAAVTPAVVVTQQPAVKTPVQTQPKQSLLTKIILALFSKKNT